MTTVARDRVSVALAVVEVLAALILAVAAYANLARGHVWYGVAFLAVVLVLALMAAIWWVRSRVEVTVGAEEIRRAGRVGWVLTWAEIGATEVREVGSLVGSQVALVLTPSGKVPTRFTDEVRAMRPFRRGLPAGALALAVAPEDADRLRNVLADHRR